LGIPLARYAIREIVGLCAFFGAAIAVCAMYCPLLVVPLGLCAAAVLAFFRDPERCGDAPDGDLVSPADGTVRDIEEVNDAPFLEGPARRIGIFMSVFDVHVNRAPASGRVLWTEYRRGAFHDARSEAAARENERMLIGMELPDSRRLLLSQIAGVVARRIVCALRPGDEVKRGERFGMVKFGSRVELYLPACDKYVLRVRPGDRVRAGLSVLASPVASADDATGDAP